jgi:hypothetical protein
MALGTDVSGDFILWIVHEGPHPPEKVISIL